ncbi:MAG: tetratricopeptide repeat protein [Phycisphaerae bacterium]
MAELEPLVAATISNARSQVLEDPYSAESWGVLGCVFDAHLQYDAAIACYAQASTLDPSDFRWAYLNARLKAYLDHPQAVALLKSALKLRPDYLALRVWLADTLFRENRLDEAEKRYLSALQLDTEHPRVLLGLGRVAFLLGRIDEASQYLRRCEGIKPNWKELQSLLARVHRQQGDHEAARRAAKWAAELPKDSVTVADPVAAHMQQYAASAMAFANRGTQAFIAGDLERAERNFSRAVKLRPDVAFRHYDMGRLRARQGRDDEAIKAYHEAIRLDPGFAPAQYNLGFVLNRTGNQEGALESLRKTVELQPNHADAHHQLGLLLTGQGKPEQTLAALRRAVELQPDDIAFAQTLAMRLQHLHREGQAAAVLRNVLSIHPGNPPLTSQLAWILATSPDEHVRDGQEALALLEPVAQQDVTTDLQLQATLAAALAQVGRFDEALAIVDRVQAEAEGLYSPFEQRIQQMREQFKKGEAFHR